MNYVGIAASLKILFEKGGVSFRVGNSGGDGCHAPIKYYLLLSLPPMKLMVGGKILGAKCPKFVVEGAVLETFSNFRKSCFL